MTPEGQRVLAPAVRTFPPPGRAMGESARADAGGWSGAVVATAARAVVQAEAPGAAPAEAAVFPAPAVAVVFLAVAVPVPAAESLAAAQAPAVDRQVLPAGVRVPGPVRA
ncbi:MAG TPA: hypothetical protein VGM42_02900 [Rhodopila sp.]